VVGLVSIEDLCVMLDEMGPIDVDRQLEMGTLMERTLGLRLRSESILSGRIPKNPRHEYKRHKLLALKEKSQEKAGQIIPENGRKRPLIRKETFDDGY
jgi:hydroxymethylglutaryl-CoA lyase